MKASIKLITTEKLTLKGYPVYVRLTEGKKRSKECIAHSSEEDWDITEQKPYKHHPAYYELIADVLEYHSKIKKINYGKLTFDEASKLLFNKSKGSSIVFYDAGLKFVDDTTNGKLYNTALNSFEKHHPGILIDNITAKEVQGYMKAVLKKQKPNGVHTYLRTLNAIFNLVSDKENPFKGIRPKKEKTPSKALIFDDVKKLVNTRTFLKKRDNQNTVETINYFRYYWLLMFYLGGIDCFDLARLRYDKHVVDGRIQFNRGKGGSSVFVNNLIVPQAWEILEKFDCKPYLVPIFKYKVHNDFVSNMNDRFCERVTDLELTKPPLTKSARYTFIQFAQQKLIDERITIEIVGHEQKKTHSIYTDEFPLKVRDEAHLKIIDI